MTSEPRTKPAARPRAPDPARVPGNLWTEIEAPEIGSFTPEARVTVILSGEDPEGLLPLTMAALEDQTYPVSLVEVLPPAARPSGGQALHPRSVRSSGEARDELLIFLPAGSIPVPTLIEAHARWHHAVSDAVSIGLSPRLNPGGLSASDVARAAREGRLEELLAARRREEADDALSAYLERTRGLTERRPELFWAASQGNVALHAETYRRAGGRGEEPEPLAALDLAWRLECSGCVFVPEREAVAPRPYGGAPPPPETDGLEERAGEAGGPRVASMIPVPGFRARGVARVHRRAALVINLPVSEEEATAQVLEMVDAILAGRFSDLQIRLQVPDSHSDRELIEEAVSADPRVSLGPHSSEGFVDSPFQVTFPPGAIPGDRTFGDLEELMIEEGLGSLHVTVPGRLPALEGSRRRRRPGRTVEVRATGPLARARRLAERDGEPAEDVLVRLFGERWASGAEFGIRRRGTTGRSGDPPAEASVEDLARERAEHLRNRARAATMQGRLDRYTQALVRERTRANRERVRADRLARRMAAISPRYWVGWRARRFARGSLAILTRAGQVGSSYRSNLRLRARQAGATLLARVRR